MDFLTNPNLSGATEAGDMGMEQLAALQKSLAAGYETDVDGMSGGSALRIQSRYSRTFLLLY